MLWSASGRWRRIACGAAYRDFGLIPNANGVLVFLAQILPPIGIMIGIYMCWVGANQPGGAFQGGTVLAAMWLLVMIAGLQEVPPISRLWMRWLLVVGPVIFLADRTCGVRLGGCLSCVSGRLRQAV